MGKKIKPLWIQKIEYLLYRIGLAYLRCLPREYGSALAKKIGTLFYYIDFRHYRIAKENLEKSNLNYPSSRYNAFIQETYQNMFLLLWEALSNNLSIQKSNLDHYIEIHHYHYVTDIQKKYPSIIYVTGHLGNWELLGSTVAIKGVRLHSIARSIPNFYIEQHIRRERERYGQVILCKKGAISEALRLLRQNKDIAFLVDQNAGSRGEFVEFFGRLASTFSAAASLSYRFNRPIIPSFAIRRQSQFFFDIYVTEPICPNLQNNASDEIHRLTQLYTQRIEEWIRKYPTQWLWFHRRWKSQPPSPIFNLKE